MGETVGVVNTPFQVSGVSVSEGFLLGSQARSLLRNLIYSTPPRAPRTSDLGGGEDSGGKE